MSASRPVIRLQCDSDVPCYDITIENVNLWANDSNYVVWQCENAYGDGACLSSAEGTKDLETFTSKQTITATPYVTCPFFSTEIANKKIGPMLRQPWQLTSPLICHQRALLLFLPCRQVSTPVLLPSQPSCIYMVRAVSHQHLPFRIIDDTNDLPV